MAKSARATVSKRNSVARRDTIHKPAEDERLQRLSQKLLEIAQAELPTDSTNPVKKDGDNVEIAEDASKPGESSGRATSTYKKRAAKGKVARARHARNAVVFPSLRKRVQKPARKGEKKV